MKLVARLQYKHAVPVLQTESVVETATLLKSLVEYHKEDATVFHRSSAPIRAVEGIHVSKKVNAEDPKQFYVAALAQCPGVSVKMAEAIQGTYPTLASLLAADEKGVASIVQANGRKVGPAVAKRLCALLKG
jgi:ERCC4-type nuclease